MRKKKQNKSTDTVSLFADNANTDILNELEKNTQQTTLVTRTLKNQYFFWTRSMCRFHWWTDFFSPSICINSMCGVCFQFVLHDIWYRNSFLLPAKRYRAFPPCATTSSSWIFVAQNSWTTTNFKSLSKLIKSLFLSVIDIIRAPSCVLFIFISSPPLKCMPSEYGTEIYLIK